MRSLLSRGARFEPVSESLYDSDDGSIQESPQLQQDQFDQFDQFDPPAKQTLSNPAKLAAPAPMAPKAPPRDASLRQSGRLDKPSKASEPAARASDLGSWDASLSSNAANGANGVTRTKTIKRHQPYNEAKASKNTSQRRTSAGSDLQFGQSQSRPKSMFIRPSPNPEGTERGRNLSFMPLGGATGTSSSRRASLPLNDSFDASAPMGPISGPVNPPVEYSGMGNPSVEYSGAENGLGGLNGDSNAPMGPITGSEKPPLQSGRWSALPTSGASKDDDDILPFAATKLMASEGRPMSAVALPSIESSLTMTNERYEKYRKSLSSLEMLQRQGSQSSARQPHGSDADSDSDDEDAGLLDNDRERRRETARRRQEQDAHLSLYRQKMTKAIGTGKPGLPTPAMAMSSTTFDAVDDEDRDDLEDVPLAALRELNFPHRRTLPRSQTQSSFASTEELAPPAPGSPQRSPRPGSQGGVGQASGQLGGGHVRRSSSDNFAPLPRVFDTENKRVSRGLVAVIAKEEDAKVRRRSMPLGAIGGLDGPDDRRHTLSAAPSLYEMDGNGSEAIISELRQQLKHVAEVQAQMLQHFNGAPMPGMPGQPYPPAHSGYPPGGYAPSGYSPSLSGFNRSSRPVSLRSFASAARPQQQQQQPRPMSSMTFAHGSGHQSPQTLSSAERRESMRSSLAPPPHTPPSARHSPDMGQRNLNNRPSMMRLVNADEDDDDDDDEEWRQMLEKRQGLRSQWQRTV